MLKMLKVTIALEIKGDPDDQDDLRDRLYEVLQVAMEDEELEFIVDEEQEELDVEE
jgi:hypothetical protein